MKVLRNEAGFTLMSVMVAAVMLAIGLLALARVQTGLVATERGSAFRSVAVQIARGYTEEVRSRDPWTLANEPAVAVNERGVLDASGKFRRAVVVTEDRPNLVRITIRIDYPGQRAPVEIVTLAYRG